MSFAVCQELFSTFSFFFFAVWAEVSSNFPVKAFVLRRFLNSEVYNTIVLFVCQQLFSFFSIFSILLFVSHIAASRAVVFIKIIQKEAARNAMHLLPLHISFIISLYSSVIYNKCFASSSLSPETRSPPVSPAKSPEICLAHRPEVLLVFSENQTF